MEGYKLKRRVSTNDYMAQPAGEDHCLSTNLPPLFSLDIFKMFRFNLEFLRDGENVNLVRAIPVSKSLPNGRFDTVVVIDGDEAEATTSANPDSGTDRSILVRTSIPP